MEQIARSKLVIGSQPAIVTTLAGDRVCMRDYGRLQVIVAMTVSSGTATGALTLVQSTAATGGSSKALAFTNYYYNADASAGDALTQATASSNTFDTGGVENKPLLYVVEVDAAALDTDNDYIFVHCAIATVTNGTACIMYQLLEPRYAYGADGTPTAIA